MQYSLPTRKPKERLWARPFRIFHLFSTTFSALRLYQPLGIKKDETLPLEFLFDQRRKHKLTTHIMIAFISLTLQATFIPLSFPVVVVVVVVATVIVVSSDYLDSNLIPVHSRRIHSRALSIPSTVWFMIIIIISSVKNQYTQNDRSARNFWKNLG